MGAVLVVKADKKGKKNDEKDIIDRMRRRYERLSGDKLPERRQKPSMEDNEEFDRGPRARARFESFLTSMMANAPPVITPEEEEGIGGPPGNDDWAYSGYSTKGSPFEEPPELWPNDTLNHIIDGYEDGLSLGDGYGPDSDIYHENLKREDIENILSDAKREWARRVSSGNWPHVATRNEHEDEEGWNPMRNTKATIYPQYYDELNMSPVPEYVGLNANPMSGRDVPKAGGKPSEHPYRTQLGSFGIQEMSYPYQDDEQSNLTAVRFGDFQDLNLGEPMNALDESWGILKM